MKTYIVTINFGFITSVSEVKSRTKFGAKLKALKNDDVGLPPKKIIAEEKVVE